MTRAQGKRAAMVSICALWAVLALPGEASACSCIGGWDPRVGLKAAHAVFRGTVIEIEEPWALTPRGEDGELSPIQLWVLRHTDPTYKAVMRVDEAWKGVSTREVVLDVGDGGCCSCSPLRAFEVGGELLVFASEHEGGLHVSSCRRPLPIEDAAPILAAYGPGNRELGWGRAGDRSLRWWAFGVVLVGLGLIAVLGQRSRRVPTIPD